MTQSTISKLISTESIDRAADILKGVVTKTALIRSPSLSEQYKADIFLKREDTQVIRSYKIRGAFNKIQSLSLDQRKRGIICASAGNHAQGVALACKILKIRGKIVMPKTTPKQKQLRVLNFGGEYIDLMLKGDTFDDAYAKALEFQEREHYILIHPFQDPAIMAGQGTVGKEILEQINQSIDYIFVPVGGGGLISGVGSYLKQKQPQIQVIGIEPAGAAAMKASLEANNIVKLAQIDKFVDGAAVKQVGQLNFEICKQILNHEVIAVPEGLVCATILDLYNREGIVIEPAGALSIAALELSQDLIRNKTVVCILSGSNNDIGRMEEIKERALLYKKLRHYFIVEFPQRAGALKEFLNMVLGRNDDIIFFEYTKKNNIEKGPAVVGIEVKSPTDYPKLLKRMDEYNLNYQIINRQSMLYNILLL